MSGPSAKCQSFRWRDWIWMEEATPCWFADVTFRVPKTTRAARCSRSTPPEASVSAVARLTEVARKATRLTSGTRQLRDAEALRVIVERKNGTPLPPDERSREEGIPSTLAPRYHRPRSGWTTRRGGGSLWVPVMGFVADLLSDSLPASRSPQAGSSESGRQVVHPSSRTRR
jgi:hypothetical protein